MQPVDDTAIWPSVNLAARIESASEPVHLLGLWTSTNALRLQAAMYSQEHSGYCPQGSQVTSTQLPSPGGAMPAKRPFAPLRGTSHLKSGLMAGALGLTALSPISRRKNTMRSPFHPFLGDQTWHQDQNSHRNFQPSKPVPVFMQRSRQITATSRSSSSRNIAPSQWVTS